MLSNENTPDKEDKATTHIAPDDQKRPSTGVHNAAPSDNPIELDRANNIPSRPDKLNRVRLHPWFKRWLPLINLIIAVFAFGVIVRQTQIMEKSFRVSERAYVGVTNVTANMATHEVLLVLENIGHVPAKAVNLQGQEIRAAPAGDNQKGSIFRWDAGEVQVFPGTPMNVVIPLEPFEQDEVNAISTKKEILYIGGTIRYEDGFGNGDSTTFAFQYNPPPTDRWTAHSDLSKLFKQRER
jgi:hypothetical protein